MSPEVLCRQNHSFSADYFALGVILHELVTGKRPYVGKTRQEIRNQVIEKQAVLTREMVDDKFSDNLLDVTN